MPEPLRQGLLQSIRSGVAAGRALPASCYRDSAFFDLELEHVLRPGWHAVARFDDLPTPGDYRSVDLCGEPLLVVRDGAGELRVFSRVCRHRAHTVVEGAGHTRRFVCPYHSWSYGLDGRLKTAPLMSDVPGFDLEKCGLPELRTERWMGFVVTSLDPEAAPLTPQLAALSEILAPHGLAEMANAGTLEFDSAWNWKVMVDNFMESYHHLAPHRETLQKTNPASGTYCMDLEGPFALLENPGTNGAPDFYVAQVFPTLLLALFRGPNPIGSWYEMLIDRHDHFHLRIHMLAPPEFAAKEELAAALVDSAAEIHREDIPVCEGVQRGVQSRLWSAGSLSRHEATLIRFHRYLAERLAGV
jgi:phenylpropionate dioxygenase-like ring-hydroxylating dioxygenase large terminal subunit